MVQGGAEGWGRVLACNFVLSVFYFINIVKYSKNLVGLSNVIYFYCIPFVCPNKLNFESNSNDYSKELIYVVHGERSPSNECYFSMSAAFLYHSTRTTALFIFSIISILFVCIYVRINRYRGAGWNTTADPSKCTYIHR